MSDKVKLRIVGGRYDGRGRIQKKSSKDEYLAEYYDAENDKTHLLSWSAEEVSKYKDIFLPGSEHTLLYRLDVSSREYRLIDD